uniref:(California timema) hypothetical protein n=1 Tax=Timema californicum TaxID=61474 RepID=A0A7R9PA31_TIMCA|nr:unnamed protein product [Timema californicum]
MGSSKKKIILEKTLTRARSIPRRDVTPVEWLQAIGSRLPRQPIGSRFLVGSSLRRSPPPLLPAQTFALTLSSPWCSVEPSTVFFPSQSPLAILSLSLLCNSKACFEHFKLHQAMGMRQKHILNVNVNNKGELPQTGSAPAANR